MALWNSIVAVDSLTIGCYKRTQGLRYITSFEVCNLNEVLIELSKPIWWISVVVAGIVINLLSAYIKVPLDKAFVSTSSWRRSRSEKRMREWEVRVNSLRVNAEAREAEEFTEIRQKLESIHLLLLSIFMMLLRLFITIAKGTFLDLPEGLLLGFSALVLAMSAATFFGSFLAFKTSLQTRDAIAVARRLVR